ncbi:hypothetical protein H6F87_29000 [Cyanobacteria bacterium FACHB-502]|nr:hypothetical protein [Cyanobacteria bacterium FACHB-502]
MPQDLSKALALKTSTAQPTQSMSQQSQSQPIAVTEETAAISTLAQTTAGTIRRSAGVIGKLADAAQQQRELVTDHEAERLAQILDPVSIQAEIAAKTLQKLEGKDFIPFELEAIELSEIRRYVPQLPQSYASQSLPSLPSSSTLNDAIESETISPGKSQTVAGTGFGTPRNDS